MFTSPSVSSFFFFLSATGIFFALKKGYNQSTLQVLHLWNILCRISSCIRSMACSLYSSLSSEPSFDFSIDQGESWGSGDCKEQVQIEETTFIRASSALPAEKYWTTCVCANLVFFTGTFFFNQETTAFCSFVICSSSCKRTKSQNTSTNKNVWCFHKGELEY